MQDFPTRSTLLQRLAGGDDDLAWVEFHAAYAALIRRVARARGLQPADVDDVVQEVFVRLGRAMPGFEYDRDRGHFRGYLKRIVVNVILDRFRQKKGIAPVPLIEGADAGTAGPADLDEIWEREWRAQHVRRAMGVIGVEFGERDRTAFHRLTSSDRPAGQVAEELGMSVNQVYQAKSRILRRLTALVAAQVEEEG